MLPKYCSRQASRFVIPVPVRNNIEGIVSRIIVCDAHSSATITEIGRRELDCKGSAPTWPNCIRRRGCYYKLVRVCSINLIAMPVKF